MFELDFNEVKDATGQSLSLDDRRFMAKVTEGIHHHPDSHYELPLPLRDESLALPNNKKLEFHRLQHLKLRFSRDEKYKKEYTAFMNDMIKKGYAEKISSLEETRQDGRIWYLPHHGVYHPQKRDKIRVVFDGSAEYKGEALNKHLENVRECWLRWREELHLLENLAVPRCFKPEDFGTVRSVCGYLPSLIL